MTEQLFINDRVKCVELQEEGFVVSKFRSKKYQSKMFYVVETGDDAVHFYIGDRDDFIKLPDMPDPPPVKAKVY